MKTSIKAFAIICAGILTAGVLTACGTEKNVSSQTASTIKVGASPSPHTEILNAVKDQLAKEGVNLEIVEFNDYVQPNLALSDGSLDANFFQHEPYLKEFCETRGLQLVSLGGVHIEPMSAYSDKVKSIQELQDGATIAVPNDPTNEGRALLLLQSAGLIKLRDAASLTATPQDIIENPHHFKFTELEAPQLPRTLQDTDLAIINMNFALDAKLDPNKAILTEGTDSPYANIIAVRIGYENRPELQKLIKALTSEEAKTFIEQKYKGSIIPAFSTK